jgi:hypothetical protein
MSVLRFLAVMLCALALAPALAHLLELPNKMRLSREEYFVVQQIYAGWWMLAVVVLGALLATLLLAIVSRLKRKGFAPALIAFLCIAGTQIVFWAFTYPMNQQTANWTLMPENWLAMRKQWEYSHAASAVLNLVALVSAIVSSLAGGSRR